MNGPAGLEHEPRQRSVAVIAGDAFAAYRGGDRDRMNELVAAVSPILWHTVRSYRLDTASAEDVLQATWMALVRRADSISDPRAVLQWLIVTARREAWRVSSVQRKVDPTDMDDVTIVAAASEQPENVTLRTAQEHALWSHIGRLTERCQRLLRVIAFSDRPDYAAVSQALGMPVGSIGPTRGRCLAQLRAALAADAGWSE